MWKEVTEFKFHTNHVLRAFFSIVKELGSANKMYDDFNKIDPTQTEFTDNFCWSRYVFYIKCNIISSVFNN